MTVKFERFVQALETLCREHQVFISADSYEPLLVWDLEPGNLSLGERDDIHDCTKEVPNDPLA